MAGKVKCTCGWSWNKSDSSVKDMYICHECGRDNSNNMKNGGWLDNIDKAQTGKKVEQETEVDRAKRVARKVASTSGVGLALDQFPGAETAYDLYNIVDAYKQGDPMKIIPNVMGALLPGLSGKSFEAISDEYLPKTPKKVKEKIKAVLKGKRASVEEIKKAQESVDWSTGFKKLYDDVGEIGTGIKNTIDDTVTPLMGLKNGGWLDNYNDSSVSLPEGYVGEGIFNGPIFENPAVKGQFQMGGNIPGAVGHMYARTGAPSEGKYAKKTLPSAQNGLDSNTSPPPPKSIGKPKDVRKKGDVMKVQSMYNTDAINYVPTVESLEGLKNPNLSPIESAATDQFVDWYSHPETLKRTEATGYDPARVKDFIATGLTTPMISSKSKKYKGAPLKYDEQALYKDPYTLKSNDIDLKTADKFKQGYILYNPNTEDLQNVLGHELPHAAHIDTLLAPSLYKALGLNLPEKYHGGLEYMDRPEEVYGNFHEMRLQMGLKPGQKIDYKTLNDKMGNDKIPNNFWRNFSADPKTGKPDPNRIKKIVKAINTVANVDTPQQDRSIQTAQNGQEMQYYQQGLDWKPKSISRDGSVIKDDRGQWDHPGEITEINSNDITMEGVPYDVLGISDTGDTKLMKPGKNYKFKGKKVTEYPMAKNGVNQQDQKTLQQLDQLTNFTNYNKPQPGGWLEAYK